MGTLIKPVERLFNRFQEYLCADYFSLHHSLIRKNGYCYVFAFASIKHDVAHSSFEDQLL